MNFLDIKNKEQLCTFLQISLSELNYTLINTDKCYASFTIPKKNGTSRQINSPNKNLLSIQRKIKKGLESNFKSKKCVHAYVKDKDIKSNAKNHLKSKHVLNIDIQDFFNVITFNRVAGMFKSHPFLFDNDLSGILAKLVCFQNRLPQGAPTSPIVSNFICRKIDSCLTKICHEQKCHYSRYADDITISSRHKNFPSFFGHYDDSIREYILSNGLKSIFFSNNFPINREKVRLQNCFERQIVTGLTVNKKLNVSRIYLKKIRATLNAIEKYGVEKAMLYHFEKNNVVIDKSQFQRNINYFLKRVVGKISFIGFIRGKDDSTYIKLVNRIRKVFPEASLSIIYKEVEDSDVPVVITEGKTDWKHLKAAMKHFKAVGHRFESLEFKFHEYENDIEMGADNLLAFCRHQGQGVLQNRNKIICVFDRDIPRITAHVTSTVGPFKYWGNNLYSMVIPSPRFRDFNEVSIEHMYLDDQLLVPDSTQRRLFFSNEFDSNSGEHFKDKDLLLTKKSIAKSHFPKIVSEGVFKDGKSVALSKNDFAEYILNERPPFNKMNFSAFLPFFETIEKILKI